MLRTKAGKKMVIFTAVVTVILIAGSLNYFGVIALKRNPAYKEGQIKVACVGDSVTYGHLIKAWNKNNYPAVLGRLMGDGYHVSNFGVSGCTVQPDGDQPYTGMKMYRDSLAYEPDILVFMMGSNDSKPENWKGEEAFIKAYNEILDSYLQTEKKPTVYLCTVATANFPEGVTSGLTNYDIQPELVEVVADIIKDVAEERNYPVIDINDFTENRRDLFQRDNVHPNNEGAKAIAETIYENIK